MAGCVARLRPVRHRRSPAAAAAVPALAARGAAAPPTGAAGVAGAGRPAPPSSRAPTWPAGSRPRKDRRFTAAYAWTGAGGAARTVDGRRWPPTARGGSTSRAAPSAAAPTSSMVGRAEGVYQCRWPRGCVPGAPGRGRATVPGRRSTRRCTTRSPTGSTVLADRAGRAVGGRRRPLPGVDRAPASRSSRHRRRSRRRSTPGIFCYADDGMLTARGSGSAR